VAETDKMSIGPHSLSRRAALTGFAAHPEKVLVA
jgi:hypothetical protein